MTMQERLNDFYESNIDLEYRDKWSQKAIELIADGYALGINDKWVVAQLANCNYQEIHKLIINKCRDKVDFWQTDEEDKKLINEMLERHKRELYKILTSDIYNYCVR